MWEERLPLVLYSYTKDMYKVVNTIYAPAKKKTLYILTPLKRVSGDCEFIILPGCKDNYP